MLHGLTILRTALPSTVRLVSSARLRGPVLAALVAEEEIAALAEIEGATSGRLLAETLGAENLPRDEFVHGVPGAAFINASFAYWKPLQPNRFNSARGAWYAALAVETCMREVAWHMTEFLALSGVLRGVVDYAEMFASMAGEFVDLRATPAHACLDPSPALGYPAGNALADAARARGLNGVIYPSVRHPGGTCIVALWPHAVQSVAPGALYRLEWSGDPEPTISRLTQ
jgi:hypothetical protein